MKREWDRNRSFVRIRFRRPTSAQLSRAVKADEISLVEPTQPLRLARQSKNNWLFVNCSGLMKSYTLERTKLVLSFLMFKVMRILVLKFSKFRKPKAFRLMTLMRLLVASSFAFE